MYAMNSGSKVDLKGTEALSAGKSSGIRKKRSSSSGQDSVSGAFQNLLQSLASGQQTKAGSTGSLESKNSGAGQKDQKNEILSVRKADTASAGKDVEKAGSERSDSVTDLSFQKTKTDQAGKTDRAEGSKASSGDISKTDLKTASLSASDKAQAGADDRLALDSEKDAIAAFTEQKITDAAGEGIAVTAADSAADPDLLSGLSDPAEAGQVSAREEGLEELDAESLALQEEAENAALDQILDNKDAASIPSESEGAPVKAEDGLSLTGPDIQPAIEESEDISAALSEAAGPDALDSKVSSQDMKKAVLEPGGDGSTASEKGSENSARISALEKNADQISDAGERNFSGLSEELREEQKTAQSGKAEASGGDQIPPGQVINPGQNAEVIKNTGNADSMVQGQLTTSPASLPQDLTDFIARSWRNSSLPGSMELTLNPQNLGKITIHLTYEAGRANLTIMTTRPETLHLLSSHADQMGEILSRTTGRETAIVLPPNTAEGEDRTSMNLEGRSQNRRESDEGQRNQKQKQSRNDRFINMMRLGLD
ncbi:MAG: flagellar hook-length control protein FliK [Lachnospiraceae bacterium]|nr:flagellar hook-length control protein FliK [Lachnospiraceae bacterium]